MARTGLVAACGALLLMGCGGDPTAIRDWSANAARVVEYRPVAEYFAPTQGRPERAPRPPAAPRQMPFGLAPPPAPPQAEPPPPPENRVALRAAQADAVIALQSVASAWLNTLMLVAADGVVPARERPFAEAALRAGRADAVAATRVSALGAVLEEAGRPGPRRATLQSLIERGNAPFLAVMVALREQVVRLGGGEVEEREAIVLQYERLARQARDPASRQAVHDTRDALLTGQSGRNAARQTYLGIVERIMQTHRQLWEQRDGLSSSAVGEMAREAEISLRRAARNLPGVSPLPAGAP